MVVLWYDNEVTQGILKKKYLHEGEETFEDLVNRVSSIYSEDIKEDVKTAMMNADLSPAGRTLYAAGMKGKGKKLSLSNCFIAGTKVNTLGGLKNIEDISVGDVVVTETGEFPVEYVFEREYEGDLYKIYGKGLYAPIVCTPNHKFLTLDGWKRADRLFSSKDIKGSHADGCCSRLKISNSSTYEPHYEKIDLSKISLADENKHIVEVEGKLQTLLDINDSSYYKDHTRISGNPVNRYITIDDDFGYFIGRWLGDGSVTARRDKETPSILQIVFNAKTERIAAQKIIDIGTRVFGIVPSVRETEQNLIAVRFENYIIASWFEQEFGHGCDGKYIPDVYLGDMNIARGLIDSDGCITVHGTLRMVLKNYDMLLWLRQTLFMNGIIAFDIKPTEHPNTYSFVVPTSVAKKYILPYITRSYGDERCGRYIGIDKYVDYIKVEKIEILEEQKTYVYNLQISTDHTYNANGVVVHNCYCCTTPDDSLESICSVDYEMSIIGSQGGGVGVALDKIRPKGAKINNSAKVSEGVEFCLRKFNNTGESIGQGNRR